MQLYTEPFPHLILDGWAVPELCRAALAEWPGDTWPHWHHYEGERGTKRATKDASRLPPACAELVRSMLTLPIERLMGLGGTFPDVHLYGAGMHAIPPGGELPLHLDSDHNPVTGHERALSGVLFLNEDWPPTWGGELAFWDADAARIVKQILPTAGRLVLFGCGDRCWHSVRRVSSRARSDRCTLSVFWWRIGHGPKLKRPQAEFSRKVTDRKD